MAQGRKRKAETVDLTADSDTENTPNRKLQKQSASSAYATPPSSSQPLRNSQGRYVITIATPQSPLHRCCQHCSTVSSSFVSSMLTPVAELQASTTPNPMVRSHQVRRLRKLSEMHGWLFLHPVQLNPSSAPMSGH